MTFRPTLAVATISLLCFGTEAAVAACKEQSLGGMAAWKRVDKLFEKWLHDGAHSDLKDWEWTKRAHLGDGKTISVRYGVTHMGNGTIELKNLMLRTYRSHQGEGFIFKPFALRVQLGPGPSGCRLSVYGNIDLLDQGDDKVIGHVQADLAYDYDAANDKFQRVPDHEQGSDKIDLSAPQK